MFKHWLQMMTNSRKIDPSVKVLIIEDSPIDSKMIQRAVSICGFGSLVAYDGRSGIEMAIAHNPKLIILDYGLPDLDGAEVLKQLRSKKETFLEPVLVLTVLDSSEVILNSFGNGADQYFKKTISINELVNHINLMVCEKHQG